MAYDALEAVLRFANVGRWFASIIPDITTQEVDPDAMHFIARLSLLELLPGDLDDLDGPTCDLCYPDAPGIAVGKIDLDGLRAGFRHVSRPTGARVQATSSVYTSYLRLRSLQGERSI